MSTAYEYGGIERNQPQWMSGHRGEGRDTDRPCTDEDEAHHEALDRSDSRAFTYGGIDRERVNWTHADNQ